MNNATTATPSRRSIIVGALALAGAAATANEAYAAGVVNPVAKPGVIVTRYTATAKYQANIRAVPQFGVTTTIYGQVPDKTRFVGSYDASGTWFHITSGAYAGRYIAATLLQVSADTRAINGQVNPSTLVTLPASFIKQDYEPAVMRQLSTSAAVGFVAMNLEFMKKFGTSMTIEESYRTIDTQWDYYRTLGYPRAAIPGTSNHGFGNAVDLGVAKMPGTASPYYYGRVYDAWMTANGRRFGWDRPDYMDSRGSNPEFWHYNFVG